MGYLERIPRAGWSIQEVCQVKVTGYDTDQLKMVSEGIRKARFELGICLFGNYKWDWKEKHQSGPIVSN